MVHKRAQPRTNEQRDSERSVQSRLDRASKRANINFICQTIASEFTPPTNVTEDSRPPTSSSGPPSESADRPSSADQGSTGDKPEQPSSSNTSYHSRTTTELEREMPASSAVGYGKYHRCGQESTPDTVWSSGAVSWNGTSSGYWGKSGWWFGTGWKSSS